MLELNAFGTLDVRSDGGAPLTSLLSQSKRAALFTYLVLSRPGEMHRRDALLALFWPELDQTHGRNALSQSLSFLRRELGDGVLVTRGAEEVGVDAAKVTSDVRAFEDALAAEDWAGAVDAYGGDLLAGLHVVGAAPCTDWVDRERERLREDAGGAAWKRAHALLASGEPTEAERMAQRALHLVPTDESPVRAFIQALADAGDRAAALRFYERFREVLAQELEVEPAPETVAAMEAVRNRVEPASGIVPAAQTATVRPGASPPVEADRVPAPERKVSLLRQPRVLIPGSVVILALVGAAGWFALHRNKAPSATAGVERAIAVLPFENISPAPDTVAWFVSGIREEVSKRLMNLGGITVRPPTTVTTVYGAGNRSLSEIANELRVDALLVGSVQVVGNRFRFSARLIDVKGDTALWQESYEGDYTTGPDIFDTQSDVAEQVASALGADPTAPQRARLERRPTENMQAWILYRQGRFHESKVTSESLHRAIELYDRAIEEDPRFGDPYAAIAGVYGYLGHVEQWRPEERAARSTAAAEAALRVDSTLAEVYGVLGDVTGWQSWDFFAAEQDYETAVRLDPNSATLHLWYAQFLSSVRRDGDAISHIRTAQEIDPIDPFVAANVAFTYYYARQYDQALVEDLKALELDSQHWVTHWNIGLVRSATGDHDGAIAELELAMDLAGGAIAPPLPALGFAYARAGRRAEAEEVLRQLKDMAETDYVAANYVASVYAGLDENDLAFEWLEKAYQERDYLLVWVLRFHHWDSMRPDPRFRALERKIGLSDYIAAHGEG